MSHDHSVKRKQIKYFQNKIIAGAKCTMCKADSCKTSAKVKKKNIESMLDDIQNHLHGQIFFLQNKIRLALINYLEVS